MKFPVIGGAAFLVSGAAALGAVALMSRGEPTGSADGANGTVQAAQASVPETLVLSVPDMHCEVACAPLVRQTLAAVPGVSDVKTDVEKQTATVTTGAGFEMEKALAALKGAGYPANLAAE